MHVIGQKIHVKVHSSQCEMDYQWYEMTKNEVHIKKINSKLYYETFNAFYS
jgi:hypothetical protein